MSEIESIKEQVETARLQLGAGNERLGTADHHRSVFSDASLRMGSLLVEIIDIINSATCRDSVEGMAYTVSEAEGAYSLSVSTLIGLSDGTNNIALQHALELATAARNGAGSGFGMREGNPYCGTAANVLSDSVELASRSLVSAVGHLQTAKEAAMLLGNGIEDARTNAAEANLSLGAYIRYIAGPGSAE